ncbi:MAG: GNAT family N-acetyltransferase [Kiritimatiellia bacterium]
MRIREFNGSRESLLPLLLLADEQESMVARYIARGTLFVLEVEDGGIVAECLVTDEGNGVLEIKSLAVKPAHQGRGHGRALIEFVAATYRDRFSVLQVGTGESPATLPFYERCGFVRSHTVKNFFPDNYDHPIYDGGVLLADMVYLRRPLENVPFDGPR